MLLRALVRPILTWLCVTLPAWLDHWRPPPPTVSPSWRAHHLYVIGKHRDD